MGYDYKDAMKAAYYHFNNAKDKFNNEKLINWICGDAYASIMSAVDSWIRRNGYESKGGYSDLHKLFSNVAPSPIKEKVLHCVSGTVILEEYGPGGYYGTRDYQKWRTDVEKLLNEVEVSIKLLVSE
jgi:hypothetical protein